MDAVKQENGTVFVKVSALKRLVTAMFERAGCQSSEASTIAERLAGASLRGHDSHGVARVPRYVAWINAERVIPNQSIKIEQKNEVITVIDGQYGFGQSIGEQTMSISAFKKHVNTASA